MPEDTPPIEDNRNNVEYWLRWIKGTKKASKCHWDDSKAAWEEYENERKAKADTDEDRKESKRIYPIYWSSCKVMEPAFYSQTPKLVAKRAFDIQDPTALTAALMAPRIGNYLVGDCNFDEVMTSAVKEFIHTDKSSLQLIYNFKESELEGVEPYQKIYLSSVNFDEYLHSPEAKCEAEIMEKAYYFCLGYEEAIAKFGNKTGLPWKTNKVFDRDKDEDFRKDIPGRYLEGWEIHCKHTNHVYWVSEDYKDGFLKDPEPDFYKLRGFFPSTPSIISSKPRKSLFPTPAFVHVQKTVCQMHEQYGKVFELIDGIRRRAIVDGSDPELLAALRDLEGGEFVASKNLQAIIDKGGVEKLIYYIPVQELVTAISELQALEDRFKENFYEWFGVPDILRGSTDPLETAKAQQIAQASAHDRFKFQKKQVQALANDGINLMLDLALQVFSPEKIARICGYDYMEPHHQERFMDALNLLKNDEERIIRLEIVTDSMSFLDEQFEAQKNQQRADTVMAGLSAVASIQDPAFQNIAFKILLVTLSGYGGSEEYEDDIKQIKVMLEEQAANPPPPPPDYEGMKLQVQQQKMEIDGQKMQLMAEAKARELDVKEYKVQADAQADMMKAQADAQKVMVEGQKAQVEAQKVQAETQLAIIQSRLEQQNQMFLMQIEQQRLALEAQRVQIESFTAKVSAQESALEEMRLAMESEAVQAEEKVPVPQKMEFPPINITVQTSKPGVKKGKIIRDEFGNSELEIEELPN